MKHSEKNIIFGLYDDEEDLKSAVRRANDDQLPIMDVLTPFPVHGLDPLLGLAESRLHIGGFVYGMIGTLTAFLGMTWIHTRDWPQIFGGKPYWTILSFVPITFELTVLFSSIGMVVTFYVINGQGPGITNPILHPSITDDKFCIAFQTDGPSGPDVDQYKRFFNTTGASLVETKTI
ncbi:MAG TPA: DUF3341 domain-containing protein [Saprospiraceae bacterium]|nr:DUF3341 domain-containing protein [Saprospiraceae bacterium]